MVCSIRETAVVPLCMYVCISRCAPFSMVSDCGVCRVFVRSTDNRPDQLVQGLGREGGAA